MTDETISREADFVLIGDASDVPNPKIAPPPRDCMEKPGLAGTIAYVDRLRAARAATGGPPLVVSNFHRFDLVPATLAAQPGFDPSFLVRTDRSWSDVIDFFARNDGRGCPTGCRISESWPGLEGHDEGQRIRDFIDAKAGAGAHRGFVYYVGRPPKAGGVYPITAALGDLRNPAYRAWQLEQAKQALALGSFDAVDLNQKFHQFRNGKQHWLGGAEIPDVEALARTGDTYFTAPPAGYEYPEYVSGWSSLAEDLRTAAVPYSVILGGAVWTSDVMDDPSSAPNEAEMIRKVADRARLVFVDRGTGQTTKTQLDAIERRLGANGVRMVIFDQSCGLRR